MKLYPYRAGGPVAVALALAIANLMPNPAAATVHDPAKATCAAAPATVARVESPGADRPQIAIEQGLFGTAVLRVDLNDAGRLQGAYVLESSGAPALDAAALSVARQARYVAETDHCTGVPGSYALTVAFTS